MFTIFTMVNALFYGFGSAIQKIDFNELEKEWELGNRKSGKLLDIINKPARFIHTMQVITNLIAFLTGSMILNHFIQGMHKNVKENPKLIFLYIIVSATIYLSGLVLMISFGIVIPKKMGIKAPLKWAYLGIRWIRLFMILCMPITFFINELSKLILNLVGIDLDKKDEEVTKENIIHLIYAGQEDGTLEQEDVEMIHNIFQLTNTRASEIMTNRKNLVCINGQDTLQEVVDFILNKGTNTRYPVYREDLDDIIGIIHMKDVLFYSNQEVYDNTPLVELEGLLRDVHFIPETRNLDNLFKEMQSKKIHMAVVVDEYGQTLGIVTMEDILEEIVGNIMDEYDVDERMICTLRDGSFIMNGMAPLEEVAKTLNIVFDDEDYNNFDTLNGYLISKRDRIPKDGEKFEICIQGYDFNVLNVQQKIIQAVKVSKHIAPDIIQEDLDMELSKKGNVGIQELLGIGHLL